MAQPSIASVSIGENTINGIGVHFGMGTLHNGVSGMPAMGSLSCAIAVVINLNDQVNIPFATLNTIFQLAYGLTRRRALRQSAQWIRRPDTGRDARRKSCRLGSIVL